MREQEETARLPALSSAAPNFSSWRASRRCMVCEDEVPNEHFMLGISSPR